MKRYGIQRNGIAVAVEEIPGKKLPKLTVYIGDESTQWIVATFVGEAEAEWFVEMVGEMFGIEVPYQKNEKPV